jgi:hypothetical protein
MLIKELLMQEWILIYNSIDAYQGIAYQGVDINISPRGPGLIKKIR